MKLKMTDLTEAIVQAMDAGWAFEQAIEKLLGEAKMPAQQRAHARTGCYAMLALSCERDELHPAVRSVLGRLRALMQDN